MLMRCMPTMASRKLLGFALALVCAGCGQSWRFAEQPGVAPRYVALSCTRSDGESSRDFILAEDYEQAGESSLWAVYGYDPQAGDQCEVTLATDERICRYAVAPECEEGGDCVVSIRGCD